MPQTPAPPSGYNYDEAKVPPFVLLDPLRADGHAITTAKAWEQHRAALIRSFEANVYGETPRAARLLPLRFRVLAHDTPALNGLAMRRQVVIPLTPAGEAGAAMHLLLYLPAHARGAVPVILGLNFQGNASVANDPGILAGAVWQAGAERGALPQLVDFPADKRGTQAAEWQVEMLLRRGYGLATVYYGDIEPDFKNIAGAGVRAYYQPPGDPKNGQWGALGAWAWGLTRALDYLRTDTKIDRDEIAVTGHSRLGKAADWAAAQDTRFAALLSTESGKGGQSLYRRDFGETIAHLERSFPYWYCPEFVQWMGHDSEIPVDGNLLLALVAPRPMYVASAEQDLFSDPRGEFLAALDAGKVYALFGKRGLEIDSMPAMNQPVMHDVAYHIRSGVHDVTAFDWEQYLNFLDLRFGSPLTRGGAAARK
jgi:hypothetical protein